MRLTPEKIAEGNCEDAHQAALMCWAAENLKNYPCLKWLYANANGGERDIRVATKLKATGVRAGVADLFLMKATKHYHGLYIEMKYGRNTPSDKQLEFCRDALAEGYAYTVCYDWEQARNVVLLYIAGDVIL